MRKWIEKALDCVINQGVYSNIYLKKHLQEVDEKDQALATRIFYGTIQNYAFCTAVWSQFVQSKKKINKKVRVILAMSVYQLLFLERVPRYAIIDEAVELTKKTSVKLAGLVNAVLRKVHQETVVYPQDPLEKEAFIHSIPVWLLKMWVSQYGEERALLMARSCNQTLPIYVRRNPLKIDRAAFEQCKDFIPHHDMYIYTGTQIFQHPYYKKGYISVQDEGSYQIACFMEAKREEKILDVCAAPGTKTLAMAEQMEQSGRIDSLDIHAHRVALIESDQKRLGVKNVHPMVQDSTNLENLGMYDKILCDVPCSGYGVLSRKPDIKLHMQPSDMDHLIPLQRKLLEEASKHVKEKGSLVYSTCTMNKKENEKQVEWFLKNNPQFSLVEQKTIFCDAETDGFYMAKISRER